MKNYWRLTMYCIYFLCLSLALTFTSTYFSYGADIDYRSTNEFSPNDYLFGSSGNLRDPLFDKYRTIDLSASPSQGELDKLLNRIAHRVVKFLKKKGLLVRDEMGEEYLSIEATQSMDQIQGASLTYKIALGKYKGKKALTLQSVPLMEKTKDKFLSRYAGFSLHCGVACPANDRKKLERVCRYISRPSLSEERLSLNTRGQVIYRLKNAYDNGTTHIVLDPLDFLSRLASLIPRPRANLTRFHGVFAPNSKYRTLVIPEAPPPQAEKIVAGNEEESRKKKSHGMTWAQRLKRVFGIDIKMCGKCGGKVKVVAAIEEPAVIEKILKHLGLDWTAPQPSPSRGPP